MPLPRPAWTLPRAAAHASPWAVSLVIHAGLAAAGLGIVASSAPQRGTGTAEPASIAVVPVSQAPLSDAPIPSAQPAAPRPATSTKVTMPDRAAQTPPPGWSEVSVTVAPIEPPAPAHTPLETLHNAALSAPAPQMFGTRGDSQAQRIVYVLDASGSMVAALPTIARELDRSLDGLSGTQWFQVVVFSGRGAESPPNLGRTLVRATDESKRAAGAWLRALEPDRRGDAVDALERALRLNPDVVFLVVKGGLGETIDAPAASARQREASLARLARAARGATASIKVIQFFDPDPSGLIEAIALTYGGGDAFRFISRKDLGIE